MEFTRETIVEALTELGEALWRRKKIADISIFGGSAMILQFDVSFVTHDIDALIESEHGAVTDEVQRIARAKGWPSTWLNEGVSIYLSPGATNRRSHFGSFPNVERPGLRVYLADPSYLLSLKLNALRAGSRDLEDVVTLARYLGLVSVEQLTGQLARDFPDEPLNERRSAIIEDLAEKLQE